MIKCQIAIHEEANAKLDITIKVAQNLAFHKATVNEKILTLMVWRKIVLIAPAMHVPWQACLAHKISLFILLLAYLTL